MFKHAMSWVFPKNDGGRDSGFHDAGVETFKGNFERFLARELIQNSLDARLDPKKPVRVKFELLLLKRDQIPGMDYIKETFKRCADYWKDDKKTRKFFLDASKIAEQRQLTVLKVSDYNTTGVPGTDTDRKQNWYHLIRCAGSSSKGGGEGGSFGIGKNAPFAASKARMVFYSTKTKDGDVAFQGVSTLVSHKLPDDSTAQPTGFLGGKHGESIRAPRHIPREFRREECGLDIFAIEYPAAETWQNDLTYSVLENFWPAIDLGDLVVTVGEQTIKRSNLQKLLNDFSVQEDFTAHHYYQAYKNPTNCFEKCLPKLKECSLFLTAGEDNTLPKKVAMVRKTGMVIYQRGYWRSPQFFCGVFLCRNEQGNHVLRDMEPPSHEKWDPDHPERGANKKIENEYLTFIRDSIKQLVSVDKSKVIDVPDLNRFLPEDEETNDELFDSSGSPVKTESLERSPLPETIDGRKLDSRQQQMQPGKAKPGGEDEDTEIGEGDGSGGGPGEGRNETDGGAGAGGGGEGAGRTGSDTGSIGGVRSKPAVPVRYRTFSKATDSGVYILVISSETKGNQSVNLVISTVGDDQKVPADIRGARLADGTVIPIISPGVFGPITLTSDTVHRIAFTLSEPIRVAMEVSAHET